MTTGTKVFVRQSSDTGFYGTVVSVYDSPYGKIVVVEYEPGKVWKSVASRVEPA